MSTFVDITEAVRVALQTAVDTPGTFDLRMTVQRVYVPEYELDKIEGIEVRVAGTNEDRSILTRKADRQDVTVNVGLVKRVKTFSTAELDPLMNLYEKVNDALRVRLSSVPASFVGMTFLSPPYSLEHLTNQHVFFAISSYVFRRQRDLP